MEAKEISDRFMAPCFVNGLEAYDEEINLGVEENMILNEFVVKLCLEHEVKRRNEVVKKELIVALMGEIYFVKFIINPKEDDVESGVEAERNALAIIICERYSILKEERPVIETMAYSEKYKKILDEIYVDKRELDGMDKEEEEAIIRIKEEALIEKDYLGAFVIPIRLEGKINLNALVDTGSDINVIPYCIYKELGREEVHNVKKGISMLNHSKAELMRLLSNVVCQVGVTTTIAKFLILEMPIDRDTPILVGRGFLHTSGGIVNTIKNIASTFDGICHQTFCATKTSLDTTESDSDDEKELWEHTMIKPVHQELNAPDNTKPWKRYCSHKFTMNFWNGRVATKMQNQGLYHAKELNEEGFDVYFQGGLRSDEHFNAQEYWLSISREENLSLSRSHAFSIMKPSFEGVVQDDHLWIVSEDN
uniref:Uncharacterized protein n=1 Tax=Tanacetum cinerariifolium TaxID=118510 RepID=A0A6L2KBL3_TANCI|nr:hypothetical protein [Tanacetum cinerariifolium]